MMEYGFTPEQDMVRDLARQIADEKIASQVEHLDEAGEFPQEIVKTLAEADLFGIALPEEFGGTNGGALACALVVEELSRRDASVGAIYGANLQAGYAIERAGTPQQKKHYLPRISKEELLGGFAFSEGGCEIDAAAIHTAAVEKNDTYVLNGTKPWVFNAPQAGLYVVFCSCEGQKIGAFLVEKGTPGLEFGQKYATMGYRAASACDVILNDCVVGKDSLLGTIGEGLSIATRVLDLTKPMTAAQAVGIAQGAMETALQYTTERKQFDAPICEFQALQFMMAKMASHLEAARALTYSVCRVIDAGGKNYPLYASMAKVAASNMAMEATLDAVQLLGGYGYIREYPVEKRMRDAKMTQILNGTNEIQKLLIARQLLKDYCKYDCKPLGI